MLVYKFGGASVRNAPAVKNLAAIVQQCPGPLVVVVSAMGKTTNALEDLHQAHLQGDPAVFTLLENLRTYHLAIIRDLFENGNPIFDRIGTAFDQLTSQLRQPPNPDPDLDYDQIISWGEVFSTLIVSAYLQQAGMPNLWMDARQIIQTDGVHRDAKIEVIPTENTLLPLLRTPSTRLFITQGFIGRGPSGLVTTLGREGSDYTASMIAFLCDAEKLVIWKDVDGVYNADPHFFRNPIKLTHISYSEAIELAYYGAKVIHPKTIKPLQNKNIPLFVKSFVEPETPGTLIAGEQEASGSEVPFFIFKPNQILISISPRDFSFIAEDNLSLIFGQLARYHVKVNLMQNSAISFSVCFDHDERRSFAFMKDLRKDFNVRYNLGIELITIRNYSEASIRLVTEGRKMLVEQKSRNTARFIVSCDHVTF